MIHKSAFYWPGCTQPSISPGSVQWVGGTTLGPSPRVLKELGGAHNWEIHTHTCHACWWQVWQVSHKTGGLVCQGQLSLPSFQGRYMSRGELPGLTKGLKLGSYCSGPGGYHGGTLVTVVIAILKAVSQGGHTAATKLL